jgi:benzoylformate decarboxylase
MAVPGRPVIALLGDGSSSYSMQALWSAAHYGVGVVFVVMGNGGYAVMDQLAHLHGAPGAWPSFDSLNLATVAAGLWCHSMRISTYPELISTLDDVVSGFDRRQEPILIDVRVEAS